MKTITRFLLPNGIDKMARNELRTLPVCYLLKLTDEMARNELRTLPVCYLLKLTDEMAGNIYPPYTSLLT